MKPGEKATEPDIAIIGTAGVPANYGGFETLADQIITFAQSGEVSTRFLVYCSGGGDEMVSEYRGATLVNLPISANGIWSIIYDGVSCFHAWCRGCKTFLVLGVSGAPFLMFLRLFTRVRIITNVDGVEWARDKWGRLARIYLRLAEWCAVRASHCVIADNEGIANYIYLRYGIKPRVIAYGGDHAVKGEARDRPVNTPELYALGLCRIEPENNVGVILQAFSESKRLPLVFVGNWMGSEYGRTLRDRFGGDPSLTLLDPIYERDALLALRSNATLFVHGHSAGGTNPSLVEAMHFGAPIICFDCVYNRYTTEGRGYFFSTSDELAAVVASLEIKEVDGGVFLNCNEGYQLREIARRRYVWRLVGSEYLNLLGIHVDFS